MNVYEFTEQFRISLRKARRMEKMGVLCLDSSESEHGAEIRRQLSRGRPLTTSHFLRIIEEPPILRQLGRHRSKAESHMAALGNVGDEAAPREVAAHITDAARGDRDSIIVLVDWLKATVPTEPVTHHWAIRYLFGPPHSDLAS